MIHRRRRRRSGVRDGARRQARVFSRRGDGRPDVADADLVVNATSERDEVARRPRRGQTLVDLPYPRDGDRPRAARGRRDRGRRPRGARRQGAARSSSGPGCRRPSRSCAPPCAPDRVRHGLSAAHVTLELVTAGESHGPALVAIVSGLPAGLMLDRAAIDADLRRRQQGYGRSPRQQIETDEVEVLRRPSARADARHAARARRPQPRPRELDVGDEPVAAGGRARREGDEGGDAAAARARRSRGRAEVRPRRRARRARAGERPPYRRASSPRAPSPRRS